MRLPASPEYLDLALRESCLLGDVQLSQYRAGKLKLPSGKLVACDPKCGLGTDAFTTSLPRGTYRVTLSIAQMESDERVAFATIHLRDSQPTRWQLLHNNKLKKWARSKGGYPVDSATGCFVDAAVVSELVSNKDSDDARKLDELEMINVGTWSWVDVPLFGGNLIAFTSGFGDGSYLTYSGSDEYDEVVVVVTDFRVIPATSL